MGKISGVQLVTANSQSALEIAVAINPVATSFNSQSLQHYTAGIITSDACTCWGCSDHAVLVVGFG